MRSLLLVALAVGLFVAAPVASAQTPTLYATVDNSISLRIGSPIGPTVRNLAPGTYTILVADRATNHNFHLKGTGVDLATDIEEAYIGTRTWTATFVTGSYHFNCDRHDGLNGSFTVGDVLVIEKAGLGQGTVTSSPAGVDCGGACIVPFPWDTALDADGDRRTRLRLPRLERDVLGNGPLLGHGARRRACGRVVRASGWLTDDATARRRGALARAGDEGSRHPRRERDARRPPPRGGLGTPPARRATGRDRPSTRRARSPDAQAAAAAHRSRRGACAAGSGHRRRARVRPAPVGSDSALGGFDGTPLVLGARWSFRGKDAGSAR